MKNKMMRLASLLMVAVLLTTSVVSGTYAKYVTSDEAEASARVAKWGVTVIASGADNMFVNNYDGTVVTATDDLVAPGTKNDTGISFKISGTPEVKTGIKIEVVGTPTDVFLAKGTYANTTTTAGDDVFEVVETDGYHPLVFTLKRNGATVGTPGTLAQTLAAFAGLTAEYDAGALANDTYTLTWEWDYGYLDSDKGYDRHDTLLGDLAVNSGLEAKGTAAPFTALLAEDFSTNVNFKVKVTVVQID